MEPPLHRGGGASGSPAPTTPQPAATQAAGSGVVPAPDGRRQGRHRRPGRRGRGLAAAGLAAAAVLALGAGARELTREPAVTAPDVGALPTAAPTSAPASTTPAPTTPAARPRATRRVTAPPVPPPAPPNGFALPGQKVTAPVVPMGVRSDGELDLPESPKTVGWWVGSPPAGSRKGTVLAGHVDSKTEGVGAFAALRDVAVGSRVVLTDTFGGKHAYTVAARRTYPKYALPKDVFHADSPLVLITCGGPFDERAGRYRDNIVVFATLG